MKRIGRAGLAVSAVVVLALTVVAVALAVPTTPKANILSPAGGSTYTVNSTVATSFKCLRSTTCADNNGTTATLGSAGTIGPLAGTLDTSSLGAHSYVVTASAAAQPNDTDTIHYTVKANTVLSDLTVVAATAPHSFTVSATLTRADTGNGLNGRTVSFRTGSTALCSATTATNADDVDGVASCTFTATKAIQSSLVNTVTATFAAAGNFFGTSLTVTAPIK